MKKFVVALSIVALIGSPVAASARDAKPVELSQTELSAAQVRTYTAPLAVTFPAVISTMQSLGYLNIDASKDAGTISGETEAKGKIFYNIVWGLGKKKRTQQASLLVEEMSPGYSVVKLNLSVNEAKARGIFGTSFKDGQLVKVGEPYSTFYSALDVEIARRTAGAVSAQVGGTTPQATAFQN